MTWFFKAASTSIGKKQIMALTGLGLCGFLVAHLSGNFLLFAGRDAFNAYANWISKHPLVIPAEAGLLALFGVHIALAVRVTLQNWRARPHRYVVRASEGARTFASATMWLTGLITLVFLVLHLIHFRFAEDEAKQDFYRLVTTAFHSPVYVIWYVFAVCALGLHVAHGLQSAVRTLGFLHGKYTPLVTWVSRLFGVAMAVGYGSIPIWAYLSTRTAP